LWTVAIRWLGRRVSLDSQNRIIAIHPGIIKQMSYEGVQVLVADTGQKMHRQATQYRPEMTPWCLQIKQYFEALSFAGPQLLRDCIVCQQADALQLEGYAKPSETFADSFKCCACLCCWHSACAQNPMYGSWEFQHASVPAAAGEPLDVVRFVCPICVADGRSIG
jgi:hypothetical protein